MLWFSEIEEFLFFFFLCPLPLSLSCPLNNLTIKHNTCWSCHVPSFLVYQAHNIALITIRVSFSKQNDIGVIVRIICLVLHLCEKSNCFSLLSWWEVFFFPLTVFAMYWQGWWSCYSEFRYWSEHWG